VVVVWQSAAIEQASEAGEGAQVAVLILSDAIRPTAKEMIVRLHELGIRPVRMLTGDHKLTAEHVAAQLGVDQCDAGLFPDDKVRILRELKQKVGNGGVGVIGDGANDAPALAAADVSIGIGSIGSDAALESSDIALLHDNLLVIPWGLVLARRTRAVVRFNIGLALTVIAGMGVATLVGSRLGWNVPLPVAVMAHEGGTLIVVLNSLRLLLAHGVSLPEGSKEEPQDNVIALAPAMN
jgi:Cd2+/Zn2+-exporting ATPase